MTRPPDSLPGDLDARPYTLDATDDVTGKSMHFEDYIEAGDECELYRNPERETGYLGPRIVYRDDQGEWRLRDLTPAENDARNARILARAQR